MCIEMMVSPMAVHVLRDGATVTVNGVRMIFSAKPEFVDGVYFTTEDSDMDGYEAELKTVIESAESEEEKEVLRRYAPEGIYPDYIKHLRPTENGASLLTRREFEELFHSGKFVIA